MADDRRLAGAEVRTHEFPIRLFRTNSRGNIDCHLGIKDIEGIDNTKLKEQLKEDFAMQCQCLF